MFVSAPQKLYLQKQDLKYIHSQIKKSAIEKLNLHLPPTTTQNSRVTKSRTKSKKKTSITTGKDGDLDWADDEEQDVVRKIVSRSLNDYIMNSFMMSKYSLVIDGKEYNMVNSRKDDDKEEDEVRAILLEKSKKFGAEEEEDEEVEVEPFDFDLNEKIRKIYYECESLTTEITRKRYEIPMEKYKGTFEKLASENLEKFKDLEKQVNLQIEESCREDGNKDMEQLEMHISDLKSATEDYSAMSETVDEAVDDSKPASNPMAEDLAYSIEKLRKYKDSTIKLKDQLSKIRQLARYLENSS